MQPSDLPVDMFQKHSAKLFHTTGITLAISQSAHATASKAVELAKQAGWLLSFDVNYRAKLWTPQGAREGCEAIMQQADILFIPLRDAKLIYGYADDSSPEMVLGMLSQRFPKAVVVMTMSNQGSMAKDDSGVYSQGIFPADEVGRLGGGDAFSAGFLYSYLQSREASLALCYGAAVAALKYSITGDFPLVNKQEVETLVVQGAKTGLVR